MRVFEHKHLITDITVKNMEKVRDHINAFDEYKLGKHAAILTPLTQFLNLKNKSFEETIQFIDHADEFVKDQNYTDE